MKGYAEREVFSRSEIEHWWHATALLRKVPKEAWSTVRCHELARAVGQILSLPVQDGHFGFVEHSWLWTEELPHPEERIRSLMPNILDVYVPGELPMVQLINFSASGLPANYRYDNPRTDIDEMMVTQLVHAMGGAT